MNGPRYFLVSYYARLPKGGFGFGRKYICVEIGKEFDIDVFEQQVAKEAKLKQNNICVISRLLVSPEEYQWNIEKPREVINQLEMEIEDEDNTQAVGDSTSSEDLRPKLDECSEVSADSN